MKKEENNELDFILQNLIEDLDFGKDSNVNPDKLDQETEKQATLYMSYSKLFADKKKQVQDQKKVIRVKEAELKEVYGELFIKYKQEPFQGKAPNDTVTESRILMDKDYKKKFEENIKELEKYNKLVHQSDILEAATTSMQQKKNMIEERIKLYSLSYNSEVRLTVSNDYEEKIHKKLNKGK